MFPFICVFFHEKERRVALCGYLCWGSVTYFADYVPLRTSLFLSLLLKMMRPCFDSLRELVVFCGNYV